MIIIIIGFVVGSIIAYLYLKFKKKKMFSEVDITLNIRNNRNYTQTINVMGNPYNLLDTSNAKTEYRWDVTSFVFPTNQINVSLQYKPINETNLSTYNSLIPSENFDGVVAALNQLGIGFFNTYVELGQTYISTYNDRYFFGALSLDGTTIIDGSFIYGSGFTSSTNAVAIQNDGKILVGTQFPSTYNGGIAPPFGFIFRLNNDGSQDTSFNPNGINDYVTSIFIDSNGKIVILGNFNLFSGGIIRLNLDGTIDAVTSGSGFQGFGVPRQMVQQSDGKYVVVGNFNGYDGVVGYEGIIRLNYDLTVDATFLSGTGFGFGSGYSIKIVDEFDNMVVGGLFSLYNSNPISNNIVKISNNGILDSTFNTNAATGFDSDVNSILVQDDGKIVVGGAFSNYDITPANRIIRLNNDGSVDATFVYGSGFSSPFGIQTLSLQDNKIVVSGGLVTYQGVACNNIIRLNLDGSKDTTWNTGTGFTALQYSQDIALQNDQKIVLVGNFTTFDSISANYIIRLLPN